ncbi:protein kinase domain-containing protein [Nocardioides terrigena]|uniref:protein kinase domain-containing protein n=1 Tax=Nocardioides terrigena TaxID=424797 RepID=UPI000D300364|nr:protein kinase [Nocardioides terrigena]
MSPSLTRRRARPDRTDETAAGLPDGLRPVALLSHGRRLDTWDAWDEERRTRVVVKVARAERHAEPAVREALLREGEIVTTLAHPHLVRGYACHDDPPAVVLETLRGATLAAVIEDGTLDLADVAELGLQLTSVLGHLHHHDWLHLDVKPANVVVDHGRAVLIDLSLAGRPGSGRAGAGTRGYLAPEQARGRDLTAATDVWGLGVTLIEAFTDDVPYGDEATWDTGRRWPLVHRRMPTVPGGLDVVPPEVRDLLAACVDLDPAARPRLVDVRAVLVGLVDDPPPFG